MRSCSAATSRWTCWRRTSTTISRERKRPSRGTRPAELAAALHRQDDRAEVSNVVERVPCEDDHVGKLAGFDRPHVFVLTHRLGASEGRGLEHGHRRQACSITEQLQLLEQRRIGIGERRVAVGAGRDQHARAMRLGGQPRGEIEACNAAAMLGVARGARPRDRRARSRRAGCRARASSANRPAITGLSPCANGAASTGKRVR